MTLDEILNKITEFNRERDWDQFHTPENLAKSISIEAGELLECFQWSGDYTQKTPEEQAHILEELADVMNYCFQMCLVLHCDPCDIIDKKMALNNKKYPVEKAKGLATKYNKLI